MGSFAVFTAGLPRILVWASVYEVFSVLTVGPVRCLCARCVCVCVCDLCVAAGPPGFLCSLFVFAAKPREA